MEQTVRGVEFFERVEDCVPSFSKGDPGFIRRLKQKGWRVYSPGNGWAYITYPSRIIVTVNEGEFDVAPFFRAELGSMTKKRAGAIIASAPREIVIEGECISNTTLDAWLARTRVCMSRR